MTLDPPDWISMSVAHLTEVISAWCFVIWVYCRSCFHAVVRCLLVQQAFHLQHGCRYASRGTFHRWWAVWVRKGLTVVLHLVVWMLEPDLPQGQLSLTVKNPFSLVLECFFSAFILIVMMICGFIPRCTRSDRLTWAKTCFTFVWALILEPLRMKKQRYFLRCGNDLMEGAWSSKLVLVWPFLPL